MNADHNDKAHEDICWILKNASRGFYVVTAPPPMQREIVAKYLKDGIAVFDYAEKGGPFDNLALGQWMKSNDSARIFFVLNMQLAFPLGTNEDMYRFNMYRDTLADSNKVWIFCMIRNACNRLEKSARDFMSYVRMRLHFEAVVLDFGLRMHTGFSTGFIPVNEAKRFVAYYADIEKEMLAMNIKKSPTDALLSAAITLENIGDLYVKCLQYDRAIEIYKRIVSFRESTPEKEKQDTAIVYIKIAEAFRDKFEYDTALPWCEKALCVCEKSNDNLGIAQVNDSIGLIYSTQGKYEEAMTKYNVALDIRKSIQGEDSLLTSNTYAGIAWLLRYQGDYRASLELGRKVLKIREKIIGKQHPVTTRTYCLLALVHLDLDEYSTALKQCQKALALYKQTIGDTNHLSGQVYEIMAHIYAAQGDYRAAIKWCEKAFHNLDLALGQDHSITKRILEYLDRLRHYI